MTDSSRYVFVNGPDIASSNSKYDGRAIRSAMMRRTLREKQRSSKPRPLSLKWVRICRCRPAEASSSLQHACGLRRLLPSAVRGTISDGVCLLCGGSSGSRLAIDGIEKLVFAPGLGRVDPFTSSGHVVDGLRYDELANYCVKTLWPGLRSLDEYPQKFYRTWMNESAGIPVVLHAIIFSASIHQESVLKSRGVHQTALASDRLRHKGRALKLVRELVRYPAKPYIVDDLLMAIVYLAMNERAPLTGIVKDSSPFMPPLGHAQWLDMYTGREVDLSHWNAVQAILRQHGGIQKLTKYGIAWLISFAGLMIAAGSLTQPVYPLLDPNGQHLRYVPPLKYLQFSSPPKPIPPTTGFYTLCSLGIKRTLIRIFIDLAELTQAIEAYTNENGICNPPDIDRFGDCRNIVQHRLLSTLASAEEDGAPISQQSLLVYLACRHAALLFSLHVTFPIARSMAPRSMLVQCLRDALGKIDTKESSDVGNGDDGVMELLLWCIVIGGIAAENTPARGFYAAQATKVSGLLGCPSWGETQRLMKLFAWLDRACDPGGCAFWREVHPNAAAVSRKGILAL